MSIVIQITDDSRVKQYNQLITQKKQMKTLLSILLVIFSIVGIADASYITWEKVSGVVPPCSPGFKCETVLNSEWSSIGPVPLSVFGIFFYSSFLILGSASLLEVPGFSVGRFTLAMPLLLLGLGSWGALFSLYLVFLMGVVLQAWCVYCLISAVNCLVLFSISVANYFYSRQHTQKELHEN